MRFIRKWLSEFRSLSESASAKYFETMKFKNELLDELYCMFNNLDSEKNYQLIDPVCHQLFNCYKSNVSTLRNFALEFIPLIVWSYFNVKKVSKQQPGGINAFLLGVYNLSSNEVMKSLVPTVFQASIYHDPPFMSATLLTEAALKNRHNLNVNSSSTDFNSTKFDSITSQNRSTVLGFAIKMYLLSISQMSLRSRKNLCFLCSKVSRVGVEDDNPEVITPFTTESGKMFSCIPEDSEDKHRTPFEPELVIELLYGMQFLMFNGLSRNALRAVQDAHFRASFDLQPHIIMVTNALLSFSKTYDMQHDLSLTPAQSLKTHTPISKEAITNASFRAKKLPDDIEVRDGDDQTPQPEVVLRLNGEILEEQAAEIERSPQGKSNKVQQVKTALKKEKSNKQQKSKDNDSTNGVSLSKKILTAGIFNNETDGIQLKVVKQNNQDFANEVSLKSKPNKLPCLGVDQKNASCFVSPVVPHTLKLSVESPVEKQDANLPTISLLNQSTFL